MTTTDRERREESSSSVLNRNTITQTSSVRATTKPNPLWLRVWPPSTSRTSRWRGCKLDNLESLPQLLPSLPTLRTSSSRRSMSIWRRTMEGRIADTPRWTTQAPRGTPKGRPQRLRVYSKPQCSKLPPASVKSDNHKNSISMNLFLIHSSLRCYSRALCHPNLMLEHWLSRNLKHPWDNLELAVGADLKHLIQFKAQMSNPIKQLTIKPSSFWLHHRKSQLPFKLQRLTFHHHTIWGWEAKMSNLEMSWATKE